MKANRLASEKSPYLRQHGGNPVDWHPWGQEAFDLARREDKPILLSVGYSACHWCHVMAHESFENPEIAQVMNANFVNIKVDREEHPDVDQVYQSVVQMLTRSGGWPLTVFLTPDLKPYFGGTYYPPEDRWGRPGFPRLLEAMARAYREQREDVDENARRLLEAMGTMEAGAQSPVPGAGAGPGLLETLRRAALRLTDYTDWEHGGFGGAPKFPNPMALSFLFRSGTALGLDRSRQAVVLALTRMAEGGIYDQLGGGFHRYSVDERWAVPHFEKMLYDNALLLRLYGEVLLGAPELDAGVRGLFTHVLVETAEYVLREMTSAHGAFWTAQDADSEGEEGRFFVWDSRELARFLSPAEARVFALRYGVTEEGNFEHQKTVLSLCMELGGIASETGLTEAEVRENLAFACSKLRAIRERRVAPGLDDKILVSWNALMVSGLAWASRALECEGHAALSHRTSIAAHRALDWIASSAAMGEAGRIWAVLDAEGEARIPGRLDDSAFLARGALDLLRFLRPEAMARKGALLKSLAGRLVEDAIGRFMDPGTGSFYLVDPQRTDLVQRPKSSHDQAIPAGASVVLDCWMELRELGVIPGRDAEYSRCLEALVPALERSPMGVAEGASVLLKHAIGPVVIKGEGSLALQGHFAVLQDGPALPGGRLQFCQRQTCSEATAGELPQRLVPGLQSTPR